jgi:hypothetical protein
MIKSRSIKKKVFLVSVLITVIIGYTNARQKYDIAAFVWPSYHPDDRAKIFWPEGIGEWQTVMTNKAKFPGHEQPRYPLWGYVNEADPYVMEMDGDQLFATLYHVWLRLSGSRTKRIQKIILLFK